MSSTAAWAQLALFVALVVLVTKPLGAYLHRVYEGDGGPLARVLAPVERWLLRRCGIDRAEQGWRGYALSLIAFSVVAVLVTYAALRLQGRLPFDPQGFAGVDPWLAWNTAVSFATNTDWQNYAGESRLSHGSQMVVLAWNNFASAAVGAGVALALARGITRRRPADGAAPTTIGNFWVDTLRGVLYVLLPLSFVIAIAFVAMGVPQTLAPSAVATTVEGGSQVIALGPVASQEAIKMLGTNGGGFFNANSAHPFENPTPLANLLQLLLIFAIPSALTWTFGRMARDQRQGWVLWAAMMALFAVGAVCCWRAEASANPALAGLGVDQSLGNLEGKEVRFGVAATALFATATTDTSCGAVNGMHGSFTAFGGLVPLVNMHLGEVVFGGVGSGLTGMLVMALLTVFLSGLMVGRTPEWLGKKIEAREVVLATIYLLVFPLATLAPAAWAAVAPYGVSQVGTPGPHGLAEILYAFTSAGANNGSAFAGLNGDTPFYDGALAVAMFIGRFWAIVPALAIAGALVDKKTAPAGSGTLSTRTPLFAALLVAVIVIVGALTFLPSLSLGPILEHLVGGTFYGGAS